MSTLEEKDAELDSLKYELEAANEKIEELEEKIEELEDTAEDLEEEILEQETPSSRRPPPHFKMPDERPGLTHKFHIGFGDLGHGYLTAGLYPDSTDVGELFIIMRKPKEEEDPPPHLAQDRYVADLHRQVGELSAFLRGVLDQLAIAVSIGLQRGIPLDTYASKYRGTNFPPSGMTKNKNVPHAKSIVDYIFRYLGYKFIGTEEWTRSIG